MCACLRCLHVRVRFALAVAVGDVAGMQPATALGRRRVQLTQEERELVDHGRRRHASPLAHVRQTLNE